MAIEIEYVGWVTFRFITETGTRIVVDPFLEGDETSGIPRSTVSAHDLSDAHVVLVTHAARDHAAQVVEILEKSSASLFCPPDVGIKALAAGIPSERVFKMVPGVRFQIRDIHIKALEASHVSLSEFQGQWLTGVPLSFIVDGGTDGKIFFSGDSALGPHYRFFGECYHPDLAFLGIGGVNVRGQSLTELYPDEAALAAKWLGVKAVIPMHYRGSEAQELQRHLAQQAPWIEVAVMKPGEKIRFSRGQGLVR